MEIVVKKGLDIPLMGKPRGSVRPAKQAKQISLNLDPFDDLRFKIHARIGEKVRIGQPLAESKRTEGLMFVSPAGGTISQIKRGVKRRLLDIVIELDEVEEVEPLDALDVNKAGKDEIIAFLMRAGLFPHLKLRPFNVIPPPHITPRAIFVNAYETRPFAPPYEMQVLGHEGYFQAGLDLLAQLTSGKVHLVYGKHSHFLPFVEAKNVEKHEALGPHPAGTSSVHIHKIDAIRSAEDYVWTTTALDVVIMGKRVLEGEYHVGRIVSLAGEGVLKEHQGYYQARMGYPVKELAEGRHCPDPVRRISGDPLSGSAVEPDGYLGFDHTVLSLLMENRKREPFHFFRLGLKKFSATRAYLSGHLEPPPEGYLFTTNQHGEERAFVDSSIYDKVMPLRIPTAHLIKAILARDFDLAQELGLLEVVPEDFALPSFVCPSKIDMISIVREGLHHFAKEMGH